MSLAGAGRVAEFRIRLYDTAEMGTIAGRIVGVETPSSRAIKDLPRSSFLFSLSPFFIQCSLDRFRAHYSVSIYGDGSQRNLQATTPWRRVSTRGDRAKSPDRSPIFANNEIKLNVSRFIPWKTTKSCKRRIRFVIHFVDSSTIYYEIMDYQENISLII